MPETFGNRLRRLIKQQGLNQQELADALDVSRNTVWRWINDKATPESYMLQNLATVLHVSVDSLFHEPPPVHKPGEWVINFKTVTRFDDKEVIDLTGVVSPVCGIQAAPDGCAFVIKAGWDTLRTKGGLEKLFRQVVRDFYKPIQAAGIAYRKIPDE